MIVEALKRDSAIFFLGRENTMMDIIEKLVGLFCIIVFVTFLVNHGNIDFSGVDWVKDQATNAVNSEEGQQYIEETKEISKNVFRELFEGIKSTLVDDAKETVTETISDEEDPEEENDSSANEITDSKEIVYTATALPSPGSDEKTLMPATYLYCSSTNTIKVRHNGTEETIRLIGLAAPHADEYKELAYDYTRSLLKSADTVYLEYDSDMTDDYGRTLAYVWLTDDTDDIGNMLNAVLIKDGFANAVIYSPNDRYKREFTELCSYAEAHKAGLWGLNGEVYG